MSNRSQVGVTSAHPHVIYRRRVQVAPVHVLKTYIFTSGFLFIIYEKLIFLVFIFIFDYKPQNPEIRVETMSPSFSGRIMDYD